jgi:hypothetical protein
MISLFFIFKKKKKKIQVIVVKEGGSFPLYSYNNYILFKQFVI